MPKVTEAYTGGKLVQGRDYEKTAKYYISDDAVNFIEITDADKTQVMSSYITAKYPKLDFAANGIFIKTEIKLAGNYSGTYSVIYRVAGTSISGAKAKISDQIYTGEEIYFDNGDLKILEENFVIYMGTKLTKENTLKYGTDYIIDESSYKNNFNAGTASVVIRGVGKYSGTKKVTFKIVKKNL
jgi:hypothetical protein